MAIYVQWDDGSISGDVTDAGTSQASGKAFTGSIQASSMQWGLGRAIPTASTGSAADRENCTPSVSEMVFTKDQDSSSGNIMRAACAVSNYNQAKTVWVYLVSAGPGGTSNDYISYQLENVLISGWSQSSGGDRPTESVTLNFTKITFNYINQSPTTQTAGPDHPSYDLAAQQGS